MQHQALTTAQYRWPLDNQGHVDIASSSTQRRSSDPTKSSVGMRRNDRIGLKIGAPLCAVNNIPARLGKRNLGAPT